MRNLGVLVMIGLAVYAAFDVLRSTDEERFGVPTALWLVIVLVFPIAGPVVWLVVTRGRSGPDPTDRRRSGRRPTAPDDDPDFLRTLDEQHRRQQGGRSDDGGPTT